MSAEHGLPVPGSTGTFLGYARIDLRTLDFSTALKNEHRGESKKARARLLKVFELEGCRRLDPHNFIDGIINRETFSTALDQAGISEDDFNQACIAAQKDPNCIIPLFPDRAIQCLNGLQRIRAAAAFLDNNDMWWIVNLHEESKVKNHLEVQLYESYSHEQEYTDGTIFRNILRYSRSHDLKSEQKWWARLTPTKRKDLKQLLTEKNNKLSEAFHDLVGIPGFWPPLQLGTLHRFHGLKFNEILVNYLRHIKAVWTTLIPSRYWNHIDSQTVTDLELMAPGVSTRDREHLKEAMLERTIFLSLSDDHARAEILQSVIAYKGLIPSIRTFFENQKYLEPCSSILKDLLGFSSKRSLWKEYKANHYPTGHVRIQCREGLQSLQDIHVPLDGLPIKAKRKFAFLQLCMFCLRNFPEMTSIGTRSEAKSRTSPSGRTLDHMTQVTSKQRFNDPALWHRLARLAQDLGFDTERIRYLADQDPEEMQTMRFLASARPNWQGEMTQPIAKIKEILKSMCDKDSAYVSAPCFMGNTCDTWPKDRRCGRPHDHDHEKDKSALFATIFYFPILPGNEITSLFVKRETLYAFFGSYVSSIKPEWIDLVGLIDGRCSELPSSPTPSLPIPRTEVQRLKIDLQTRDETISNLEDMMRQQAQRSAAKEVEYREEMGKLRAAIEKLGLKHTAVNVDVNSNDVHQQLPGVERTLSQVRKDVKQQQEIDSLAKALREMSYKYKTSENSLRKLQSELEENGEEATTSTLLKEKLNKANDEIARKKEFETSTIGNRHSSCNFTIVLPRPDTKGMFQRWDDYWLDYDATLIFERALGTSDCLHVHVIAAGGGRIYSNLVKIPKKKKEIELFLGYLQEQSATEPDDAFHLILGAGSSMCYRRITSSNEDTQSLLQLSELNTAVFYSNLHQFPLFFERYRSISATRSAKRGGGSLERGNGQGRRRVHQPDDEMDTDSEL